VPESSKAFCHFADVTYCPFMADHGALQAIGVFRVDILAMIQLPFLSHFWSDL
jgi:hypothetical protein